MKTHLKPRIACFISPHGFGHAARVCGIMAAIHEIDASICFEIFTRVPEWFFQDSLFGHFNYHPLLTDIGLVQTSPLYEDVEKTIQRLNEFLPFDPSQISELAQQVIHLKCRLVICDIAPMGIAVGRQAGIPSILIENFTWDWIYEGYTHYEQIKKHIAYLGKLFKSADYHIQTEPVCSYENADLTTFPISRKRRTSAHDIRKKLNIPDNKKMVMITMGGVPSRLYQTCGVLKTPQVFVPHSQVSAWEQEKKVCFVIPGASHSVEIRDNLILLPHQSEFFHPDLVNACDAVIGKVGYSTLAEVFHAGVPFGYVARPSFRESEMLVRFIEKNMPGFSIQASAFEDGTWISCLPKLLDLPRIQRNIPNGADQAAEFICGIL